MESTHCFKDTVYGKISSVLGLTGAFLTLGNIPFIHTKCSKSKVQSANVFQKKTFFQKLSQVPVFAIATASGQPYRNKQPQKGISLAYFFFIFFW